MKTVINYATKLGLRKSIGIITAVLVTAAAVGGCLSTAFTTKAANAEGPSRVGSISANAAYNLPPLW